MIDVQAPRQGIAQSPHVGFEDVRNLDIFTTPGVAKLNNILAKKSASTVDALVKWIVKNPASPANIYAIDTNGSVYNSADSGATWAELSDRDGAGQGLAVWKDYLFVFEDTTIDVYGPLSGAAAWSSNWQTIGTDSLWHPAYVSKNDGKLYFGCGRYMGSIDEVSGQNFAPGTPATYSVTLGTAASNCLDLPEDYRIKCLAELGNNLMIGTWVGAIIYQNKIADIFPWDRVSPSFGQPIQMTENGVNAMINIGNQLYVMAGIDGKIFRCDGYNAVQIAQIPQTIASLDAGLYLEPYPGAMMNYKGRLWFGVSGSGANGGCGVYSLMQTSQGTILNFENEVSTENMGATITQIGALLGITRDTYLCGWRSNTTYGIDSVNNAAFNYTTTYQGYFITPFYRVGSTLQPFKFTQLEFRFAKPLAANEGIKIDYRINLSASWTNIGTYTYANLGAILSKNIITELPQDIKACEQIQLKISLTGTTTTPHFTNLRLL